MKEQSKKVAFLALTYSSFAQEGLMEKFFSESHDYWNLYIHNKTPFDSQLSKFCVEDSYKVETSWGYYSVVLASIRLMAVALQDPDNEWFVLISGAHCPLFNVEKTCEKVRSEFDILSFSSFNGPEFKEGRYGRGLNKHNRAFSPFKSVNKVVSQFFICKRADAELFVSHEPKLRKWFSTGEITYSDEIYFYMVAELFNLPFQVKSHCHDNFDLKSSRKMIISGARPLPKTYTKVNKNIITALRKTTSNLFIRKVSDLTQVDEDFILHS